MKEFKTLKILDKLSGLYKRAGVDYDVLRVILKAKLTMDGRRKSTIFNNDNKKSKKDSNEFFKALIIYAIVGAFMSLILLFDFNIMYIMAGYFSAIMIMILTVFISDFSYVLLDVRDKNILLSRGISNKTINAAKITHVFIYVMYLTLSLVGVAFILSLKKGIVFFAIFVLSIIFIDIFMIIITALSYLLILKIFDGEKLKDMINFVQIFLSILMVLIYQIVPRLFGVIDLGNITYNEKLWHLLIPPMWFAAPLSIVYGEGISIIKIIMSLLALIVPILSIIIYIKLIPTFERNLQKLNNNSEEGKEKNKNIAKVSNFICRDNIERAFFRFSVGIINSEREFKLKVYPNLGLGIVLPFVFLFIGLQNGDSFKEVIISMRNSNMFLSVYAFALVIPNIIIMLSYSERYLGAWIYKVAPINNYKNVFKGVIKGAFYKLIIPPFIVLSLIFIWIFGARVIIHLIISFLSFIILTVLNFSILKKAMPFSRKFEATNSSESLISVFGSMFCVLLLWGLHYLAILFNSIIIYTVILIILNIVLWNLVFNFINKKLKSL